MSKRSIALILAALLCCAASLGETREGIIYKEGEPEPIYETRWDSALGFSFWYDAEALTVAEDPSEDGGSLIVSLADFDLPVRLEIMTPQRAGVLPWKFLELNAPAGVEYRTEETEEGGEVHCFDKPADYDAHIVECYYAVEDGEDFVVAVSAMPEDAVEGWGKVFDRVVCSVNFAPPLRHPRGSDSPAF